MPPEIFGADRLDDYATAISARVVVEPDADHAAIAVLSAEAGFRVVAQIPLATKTAALSVATREARLASPLARP